MATKLVIKGIEVSAVGNNAKNVECVAQNGTKSNVQSEITELQKDVETLQSETSELKTDADALQAGLDTATQTANAAYTALGNKADINGSPTFNNVAANSYTANAGVHVGGSGVYAYHENGYFMVRENRNGGGYTYNHFPRFSLSGTTLNITY